MRVRAVVIRWIVAAAVLAADALAAQALRGIRIYDDGRAHPEVRASVDPAWIPRVWPLCPTDRIPCKADDLAWIHLEVSLDVYSARRNDPHDSVERMMAVTRRDLATLTTALRQFFSSRGVSSDVRRVGFVQGLVQAVTYRNDLETGWTEYPKFGLEFLVDEQGDCDDAAIATGVLLDSLGYSAFFVDWVSDSGPGHLSTAVRPDRGDLRSFQPPDGSPWIEYGGLRLLHVDGTGTAEGCGRAWGNCAPLGFNPLLQTELKIASVIATSDAELDRKLPIAAWNNGGRERPNRQLVDRRNATDEEIREEQLYDRERLKRRLEERLSAMGIDESGLRLRPAYPWSRGTYYTVLAVLVGVIVVFFARAWRQRRRRQERAARRRQERRDAEL